MKRKMYNMSYGIITAVYNWAVDQSNIEQFVINNCRSIEPTEFIMRYDRNIGKVFIKHYPEAVDSFMLYFDGEEIIQHFMGQTSAFHRLRLRKIIEEFLELEIGRAIKKTGYLKENKELIDIAKKKDTQVKKVINQ